MLYFETEVLRMRSALGYHTDSSRRVVAVKQLIDRQYADDHSLESLARVALVSRFHFARRFRALYGSSPLQYLTEVRLKQSAVLLKQGTSVLDTCHAIGFGSPTTFSGLFKKKMGVTPSGYRMAGMGTSRSFQQKHN
ncbi:MAG: AraC family transcriptional regulator [Chitinophagaceae bacterium]|nr:MAG: AraC family transcriptional regulator [Chitinophagaceae bacterium]